MHVEAVGEGPPAIFVHGSFRTGLDAFAEQRALADEYRILIVDRRGYGGSVSPTSDGWPSDARDLIALLDEVGPAHLVGHSYGGVVALLAAGLLPERVRSLVAIEPVALQFAHADSDVDATNAALKPVYERAARLTAAEFAAEWGRARGMSDDRLDEWTADLDDAGWAGVEASRRERWPGDAPIQLDELAEARFPKVLARGGWRPEVVGRAGAGRDFAAVCRVLADRIGARTVVFEESAHNPHRQEPERFNRLLRDVWSKA